MVKKRGLVWSYYDKKIEGSSVTAFCKFCNRSYIQNATRMEKHLARCDKASPDVKQLFLRVFASKKFNRARLLGAKIGGNFIKPNGEVTLDISSMTEADLEDIHEWSRQKDMNNEDVQNLEVLEEDDDDDDGGGGGSGADADHTDHQWSNQTDQKQEFFIDRKNKWIKPDISFENVDTTDQFEEIIPEEHPRVTDPVADKNIVFNSQSSLVQNNLQNKILQEQLLERRAFRKIAELELKKKMIEVEKCQWEYERLKNHDDTRWTHEAKMMQLKEEKEKKLIAQIKNN